MLSGPVAFEPTLWASVATDIGIGLWYGTYRPSQFRYDHHTPIISQNR